MFYVIKILFLFFITVSVFSLEGKLVSESHLELEQIKLNQKLEKNLNSYLQDIKFSSFLSLNYNKKSELSNFVPNLLFSVNSNDVAKFEIKNVEVNVIVYESLNNIFDKELRLIIENTLKPYRVSKVNLKYLESTKFYSEQLERQRADAGGFLDKIFKNHISDVVTVLSVGLFSIVLIIAVIVLAKMMKGPLNIIAQSFRDLTKVKSEDKGSTKVSEDEKNREKDDNKEKFRRNLEVFKDLVLNEVIDIKKINVDVPENRAGIKKIIPYIYDIKVVNKLKKNISRKDFLQIENETFSFKSSEEFLCWFNSIVERLSFCALHVEWDIVSCLEESIQKKLRAINVSALKKYLDYYKSSLGFQIIISLLPVEERASALTKFELEDWAMFVSSDDVSGDEVLVESKKIIEYCESENITADIVDFDELKRNMIIPSITLILQQKSVKVQDDFISSISNNSEDFLKDLAEFCFIPKNIFQIPYDIIKDYFRRNDAGFITKVICSMPVDVQNFMKEQIPDGNLGEIILDGLKTSSISDKDTEAAGKSFLRDMHALYMKKEFSFVGEVLSLKTKSSVDDTDIDDLDMDDFDMDDLDIDNDAA